MASTNIPGMIISNVITLTPDGAGLITLPVDETGEGLFVVVNGADLKGIRPMSGSGDWEPSNDDLRGTIWLSAPQGSTTTIHHLDGATSTNHRIRTTSGANTVIDEKDFAVKYTKNAGLGYWVWKFDVWA